nr:ankyrin repeat-containing protein At2g01680-like [Setaria viridis]
MRAGGEALCARNCLSATALFEAVRHGHAAVVDLLMVLAPELASVATNCGVSPLYLAATTDSLQMVRALLRPSQDGTPSPVSFSGPAGRTALHAAAVCTDKRMAQEMLAWEPEGPSLLSRVDSSGRTPLHFAALYGRLDVVQLFLAVPTSVELAHIADSHGQFPLHAAAMKGNTRVLDELMKKCPDHHELVDDKGRNLLHCAVEHNQRAVVRHVCQDGNLYMLLNAMDHEGNSPLHLAAKYRFIRIVSILLLTMTVETSITNKDGLTAGDRLPCVDVSPLIRSNSYSGWIPFSRHSRCREVSPVKGQQYWQVDLPSERSSCRTPRPSSSPPWQPASSCTAPNPLRRCRSTIASSTTRWRPGWCPSRLSS